MDINMKCQKCNKREANSHIKRIINGQVEEYHLCSECAREMGYSNVFDSFTSDFASGFADTFGSLFGSFFDNALPARTQATRCETCGASYADIARTGMMGCADCYSVFEDRILPTVRRIHGNTAHCGKNSPTYKREIRETAEVSAPEEPQLSELDKLKAELDSAVKNQEFEKAAELRDKIKAMEDSDE